MPWYLPQWALVPAETTLWVCCLLGNQVVHYCALKLAIECVGPGIFWESLQCRPRSATSCDWPGAT